jgi:succinyl-CoA synthetase beta subunit
VVKVDQGIKKRGKQGLIKLGVTKDSVRSAVDELSDKGFDRFIVEPLFPHKDSEEHYLSIELTRAGLRILYSDKGGITIEEHPESIQSFGEISEVPLSRDFLQHLVGVMEREHMSFLEVNPLVVQDDTYHLLDAAVLVDSAGEWTASWTSDDIVDHHRNSEAETEVSILNDNSPASFSLRLLNPDGSLWFLLSGGGASITIADEAFNMNKATLIGNYGEYSGGPTQEEVEVYTDAVLKQMFASTAQKRAIIIAGGVANFTDVKKTFMGIITVLEKHMDALINGEIKVFVRRGGPNEAEGLKMMEQFLRTHKIFGSIYGSDVVLTRVVSEALEYVDA